MVNSFSTPPMFQFIFLIMFLWGFFSFEAQKTACCLFLSLLLSKYLMCASFSFLLVHSLFIHSCLTPVVSLSQRGDKDRSHANSRSNSGQDQDRNRHNRKDSGNGTWPPCIFSPHFFLWSHTFIRSMTAHCSHLLNLMPNLRLGNVKSAICFNIQSFYSS